MAKRYFSKQNDGKGFIYVKDEEARKSLLYPVDVNALTPSTSFKKNDVLGLNGVLYRCKQDTADFPVTLVIDDGEFVIHVVNGKKAFVIADPTIDDDWEVFTDASVEYWVEQVNARIDAANAHTDGVKDALAARISTIETALSGVLNGVPSGGQTYTIAEVLTAIAPFMNKILVTKD